MDGQEKATGEVCLNGEKSDRMAFPSRANYQNHAIGWLQRGCSSLGVGTVVQFPRLESHLGNVGSNISSIRLSINLVGKPRDYVEICAFSRAFGRYSQGNTLEILFGIEKL